MKDAMFCFQCQETMRNTGCTSRGVCGKPAEVANLQDLLIYLLKGIAFWGTRARDMDVIHEDTNIFVAQALFATITNANFDPDRFVEYIREAIQRREELRAEAQARCEELHGNPCTGTGPDWAGWQPESYEIEVLLEKANQVGVMVDETLNEDIRSLRELITYGLKGMAAYVEHAYVLDVTDSELLHFIQEMLEATTNDKLTVEELTNLVLKTGEMGLRAMALLDQANTDTYGHPEPTQVFLGVRPGPGILVSGHDLRDLDELLQQTEGSGVNVYTHGEMLPAQAYPAFKKYAHFAGNYGGSWFHQREEFENFNGPILMTTNCIVTARDSYLSRLFTTGQAGYPDAIHIPDRKAGEQKDFSGLIELAKTCADPQPLEDITITTGFARNTVLAHAGTVVDAVKAGDIQRFVVMAGCDGRHKTRQYYTDVAEALPDNTVILTAGCAKYRYNKLDLGEINGIPRILDAGQCNDSYSLIRTAQALAEVFEVADVNDLPISYDIAWYEQKAVIVLLALLYLGIRKIRLGPTLPAFLSPNVIDVLVKNFNLMPIGTVEEDVAAMMAGN
ncbi:MAG TPA: hydroxylamine reductase [Brevefilum sp.]|nr:hydroxylamine reductase [Brevefilum sp.]HOR18783.1 hydroxylamine reductase [Brevefilum sp.]HPL68684.1 hydroxylamine reductase [Brevefilum sp.]